MLYEVITRFRGNLPGGLVAVDPGEGLAAAELAAVGNAGEDVLGVALADAVERFAGDDVEMPGLV